METREKLSLKPGIIGSSIVLAIALVVSAWAWIKIPAGTVVPTHWNAAGQVDGYAGKLVACLIMPAIIIFVDMLMVTLGYTFQCRRIRISTAIYTLIWLQFQVLILLGHIHILTNAVRL